MNWLRKKQEKLIAKLKQEHEMPSMAKCQLENY